MERGILSTLKRKTRKHIKSVLNHRLARARKRIALKEANKPPERSHGDERILDECHQEFKSFSKEVRDLGHKFEEFMRAIRPIGSSSGLICTSKDLQQYMNDVLYAFRSNSAEIWRVFAARSGNDEMPDDLQGSSAPAMSLLPKRMGVLSEGLNAFLGGLRDIPEFSDKLLTDSLLEFRDWLVYRAECLESRRDASFEGSAATRRYISQVMKEMSLYIRKAGVALQAFTEGGAKAIQDYQKRSQGKLQNMSTVATFFSGVTATTMQYAMNQERMGAAVMGLWISSLILSIASAINSQLAMHWRAAMYRSPRSALPIWTSVCLDHTPLLCLIGAVLAFSTGLVVWTFAADLALAVKICAAGMTCATSVILFTVIIWEGGEWWQESRKRQMDSEQIAGMPALHYPWQPWRSTKRAAGDARSRLSDLLANAGTFLGQKRQKFVKLIRGRFRGDPQPPTLSLPGGNPNRRRGVDFSLSLQSLKGAGFTEQVSASRRSSLLNPGEVVEVEVQNPEAVASPVPGTATSDYFALNRRGDTNLPVNRRISPTLERFYRVGKHLIENDALRASLQTNRPENSRPRRDELRSLCPVQMLPIYHPAGRDIHFSPDGTRLAVGVLDGYMAIWDVGKYDEEAQTIISPVGRFAWSPDSSYIVIIMDNGLLIWNKDSGSKAGQIRRPIGVIAWLQDPSTFLAMVDYVPHILDTEGKVRKRLYRLPLHVHDVASMPSQQTANYGFILVLGTLIDDTSEWASGSRFTRTLAKRPKDAIPERRLMVIDADTDASFAEASILADARHVCVSREGSFALVSYANGDCPELWQLQDRFGNIQLELCRGYAPRSVSSPDREADKISGKARFCGESDEWVMATNGRSEIYIWDRAMGHLLHTLQATQIASKWPEYGSISTITSKTINDSKTNLTVVSTCTNGGVVIWECPDLAIAEVQSNASEAESPGAGTIDLNDP